VNEQPSQSAGPALYLTKPHPCAYLGDRDAAMIVVDPEYPKDKALYTLLVANGFRRSGEQIYRPRCEGCQACVPVRLPVRVFKSSRAQRRSWQRNQDLEISRTGAALTDEAFALYHRYINTRHAGGSMEDPTHESYLDFLTSSWCETEFHHFRIDGKLLAVAVVDVVEDGLSSVYTYFDPDAGARSLGVYTLLWTVEETRRRELDWLYIGYWIEDCQKMSYKRDYQPQQHLRGRRWLAIDDRRPPFS